MTAPTTRPRNFSPWFQVVTRLAATVEADPLPDTDLASFETWRTGFARQLDDELGPWPDLVATNVEIDEGEAAEGFRKLGLRRRRRIRRSPR